MGVGGHARGACRRALGCGVALVLTLIAAPPAGAGDRPPNPQDNVSGVEQYVEDIPTAEGPVASGAARTGRGDSGVSGGAAPALEPHALAALSREDARVASKLKLVATSPRYGAPARALPREPDAERSLDEGGFSAGKGLTTATAASSSGLVALIVLLVGITAGVVAAAARRARR